MTTVALLVLVSACSPFRVIDKLVPEDGYRAQLGVVYGETERQRLDIYTPIKPNNTQTIVMFLYGGSWRSGERGHYRFVAQPFAAAGFTTVVPDYRIYPKARFPDFVEDAAAAIAWVQRVMVKDAAEPRILLIGHSAGAHIAALLALDKRYLAARGLSPKILKGWVGLAGPYAFNPLKTRSTKPIFASVGDDVRVAQPIHYVRAGAPPALLLHGTTDTTVYPLNSKQLSLALRDAGSPVVYRQLKNVGHVGIVLSIPKPGLGGAQVLDTIIEFARKL